MPLTNLESDFKFMAAASIIVRSLIQKKIILNFISSTTGRKQPEFLKLVSDAIRKREAASSPDAFNSMMDDEDPDHDEDFDTTAEAVHGDKRFNFRRNDSILGHDEREIKQTQKRLRHKF